MTPDQRDLLIQAVDSLKAARLLNAQGLHGFAASRAYFAMFYVAEAFLLGKGLAFSKHSAVHAAFGQHFAKTGVFPSEFHLYLLEGMEVRHAGDYGKARSVPPEDAAEQIARAEKFLKLAELHIGPIPSGGDSNV